ncbi:hypothetical protein [Roseivirga echinicomitans]|uniref:Pentapeptide repeat-containing protein n=1 Tax=Roseivirga echinicomitans TaxID=296218 RepID=A0A150XWW1_9BACT|nr:hypothetical protein [Roseivirga echinicomitans]KYG83257.1 hypothetical protein AWN68_00130 [Roseivirga echinicomitans]
MKIINSQSEFDSFLLEKDNRVKDQIIDGIDNPFNGIVIKDIVVRVPVRFNSKPVSPVSSRLLFLNAEFQSSLVLSGQFLSDVYLLDGKYHESINFENCRFSGRLVFLGGQFNKGVSFKSGEFVKEVLIIGGTFFSDFDIEGGEFKSFEIHGGEFRQCTQISGGKFEFTLSVSGGEFYKGFEIDGGIFNQGIIISGGTFISDFSISDCTLNHSLIISGGNFFDDVVLQDGNYQSIEIKNKLGFINVLCFLIDLKCEVRIENTTINVFELSQLIKKSGALYLKKCTVNEFVIDEFENEGKVSIFNLNFKEFITLRNPQGLKIETKTPSKLVILDSDLGKLSFFDAKFDKLSQLIISGSKLIDISTTEKHLPLSTETPVFSDEEGTRNPESLAQVYNQLFIVMQRLGNKTQELKYFIEYMKWHKRALFNSNKERFKKAWRGILSGDKPVKHIQTLTEIEWSTSASLWLNKTTNKFGVSWIRAFGVLLLIAIPLYIFFLVFLPNFEIHFGLKYLTSSNITFHIAHFLYFLLPIHKFDFVNGVLPDNTSLLIDVISRILVGYMLYQFIAAFRQFGKR